MFPSIRNVLRGRSPVNRSVSMREAHSAADDADSDDSFPKTWAKKVTFTLIVDKIQRGKCSLTTALYGTATWTI